MREKPKISPEVIAEVEQLLAGKSTPGLKKLATQIQKLEPHLWEWFRKASSEDVAGLMTRGLTLDPHAVDYFGNLFIRARLAGFLLSEKANDYQWADTYSLSILDDRVVEDPRKKYEAWLNGELSDEYYRFNIPDPKLEPEKAKALENHRKLAAEQEQKEQERQEQLRAKARMAAIEKEAGIASKDLPQGVTKRITRKITDFLDNKDKK